MTWLFTLALFVHLMAVLLMVAAMALQATVALLTRQAATPADVRRMLNAARWIPRLFAPATLLILLSGIYMAAMLVLAGRHWGWIAVALVALVAVAAWGKSSGQRRNTALARLLADSGTHLSPPLQAALRAPAALMHVVFDIWAIAGLMVLMVYQPGIWISIAVMVAVLLGTAAVSTFITGRMRDAGTAGSHPSGAIF